MPSSSLNLGAILEDTPWDEGEEEEECSLRSEDDLPSSNDSRTHHHLYDAFLFRNTEYSKYFLMLKAGVPKQWVVKICQVDGRDPTMLDRVEELLLTQPSSRSDNNIDEKNDDDDSYYFDGEGSNEDEDSLSLEHESQRVQVNHVTPENGSSEVHKREAVDTEPSKDDGSNRDDGVEERQGNLMSFFLGGWGKDHSFNSTTASESTDSDESFQEPLQEHPEDSNLSQFHDAESDETRLGMEESREDNSEDSKGGDSKGHSQLADENDDQGQTIETQHQATEDQEDLPISKDPKFSRYFLMLKARVPLHRVRQVVEMDGKDPDVLELDPMRSFASQVNSCSQQVHEANDRHDATPNDTHINHSSCQERSFSFKRSNVEALLTRSAAMAELGKPDRMDNKKKAKLSASFMARRQSPRKTATLSSIVPESDEKVQSFSEDNVDMSTKAALLACRQEAASVTACAAGLSKATPNNDEMIESSNENKENKHDSVAMSAKKSTLAALLGRRQAHVAAETLYDTITQKESGPSKNEDSVGLSAKKANIAALFARRAEMATTTSSEPEVRHTHITVTMDKSELDRYSQWKNSSKEMQGPSDESVSDVNAALHSKGDKENALKDHPEYQKYFKMLKFGLPVGAVKQAMVKEGKDSAILDMNPQEPLNIQKENISLKPPNEPGSASSSLRDDPEYQKYFKMLKLGLPLGAVKQAMVKDGKDSSILDLDPDKPSCLQKKKETLSITKREVEGAKPSKPQITRKRLFWNSIDGANLRGSLWSQFQSDRSLDLSGLDYDEEEFASLFTLNKAKETSGKTKSLTCPQDNRMHPKKAIQLIDSRRQMNGSILLTKYKHDYRVLAKKVDRLDSADMCETELLAFMQLLPSKDEALAIRSYLPESAVDRDSAISKLGEVEKYMAYMLEVNNAHGKLKSMIYRVQFNTLVEALEEDTESLREAVACVRKSDRLARLMLFVLRLGNTLNTGGGSGKDVAAITLDSLLKLQEAKAFDNKTSVLHYLVTIVEKNDRDILHVSSDLLPALKAERITLDSLAKSIDELKEGLEFTKSVAGDGTIMTSFCLEADKKLLAVSDKCDQCKQTYADLLAYFGENPKMPLNEFFGTLARFIAMFESARAEVQRLQEAKARKERKSRGTHSKKSGAKAAQAAEDDDSSKLARGRSAVLQEIVKRASTT